MGDPTPLEKEFHQEMLAIYQKAKSKCHYNATRFLNMVSNDGGLLTAKKLLATELPSDGFTELWDCGCLHLTVEALVINLKYQPLFTQDEIQKAHKRLIDYEFKVSPI